jgi:hypothetical protein
LRPHIPTSARPTQGASSAVAGQRHRQTSTHRQNEASPVKVSQFCSRFRGPTLAGSAKQTAKSTESNPEAIGSEQLAAAASRFVRPVTDLRPSISRYFENAFGVSARCRLRESPLATSVDQNRVKTALGMLDQSPMRCRGPALPMKPGSQTAICAESSLWLCPWRARR